MPNAGMRPSRLCIALLTLPLAAGAPPDAPAVDRFEFEHVEYVYPARYFCGRSFWGGGPTGSNYGVLYETRIYIRNAGKDTSIGRETAVAPRASTGGGRVFKFPRVKLFADSAVHYHCHDFLRGIWPREAAEGKNLSLQEGFVVIRSPHELDVVALYTSAPNRDFATQHSERVPGRRVVTPILLPDSLRP